MRGIIVPSRFGIQNYEDVKSIMRYIDRCDSPPSFAEIAEMTGIDPRLCAIAVYRSKKRVHIRKRKKLVDYLD